MNSNATFYKSCGVFFLICSSLFLGPSPTFSEAGSSLSELLPDIHCSTLVHDFGTVPQGKKISYIFKISNAGPGTLEISAIKASCACTVTSLASYTVASAQETELEVLFDTSTFRGKSHKEIAIYSNDPDEPILTLAIEADIVPDAFAHPAHIYLGDIKKDDTVIKQVTIRCTENTTIQRIESSVDWMSAEMTKEEKQGPARTYELTIRVSPQEKNDTFFNNAIKVYTNSKHMPVLVIPVGGRIVGNIYFYPNRCMFGVVKKGSTVWRKVKLSSYTTSFHITKIEKSSPYLEVKFSPLTREKGYEIFLSLLPSAPVGILRNNIEVHTDHPDQPRLLLQVFALIKEK